MRPLSWSQAEHTGPTVGEVVRHSEGGGRWDKERGHSEKAAEAGGREEGSRELVSREKSNGSGDRELSCRNGGETPV